MKPTLRNSFILGTFALTCLQMGAACSAEDAGPGIGIGSGGTFTSAGTPAATSGTGSFTTPMGGTAAGGTPTTGFGGTFANAGTFSSAGTTTETGGTATGGTATGGTGTAGTATGGTATGGTDAGAGDFPAGCPAPSATAHGATALTRTCWGAKASDCAQTNDNKNPPTQAIDAAGITTRFATGVKMTASKLFTYDLDLGSAVMVNGVSVVSEAGKLDYAPQLEVLTSMDGNAFTPVACGTGAVTTDFSFTATNARYIRFIQHGIADSWWSVWDLNVYAATGDTCAGGGTQMNTCTTPHTQ